MHQPVLAREREARTYARMCQHMQANMNTCEERNACSSIADHQWPRDLSGSICPLLSLLLEDEDDGKRNKNIKGNKNRD